MQHFEFTEGFEDLLEAQGFRGKIVSIAHVKELQQEIDALHRKNLLDRELYDAYLASFDFGCQQELSNARSLIIVSVPQPRVRVTFVRKGQACPVTIPPTYAFSPDNDVKELLGTYFESLGYRLQKVRLPQKLLAVRSGLAQYGKNNITYVAGLGSFHRPMVFMSDCPPAPGNWKDPSVLDQCENCSACVKACPTHAIARDRFLLHAERCITFHNERTNDFPEWLSPSWHCCLVGCMVCQQVCPANRDFIGRTREGPTFDNEETALLLGGAAEDNLPRKTLDKLERLGMMEYINVIGRNLKPVLREKENLKSGSAGQDNSLISKD
jgi:epoxyqueuosine reductase